MSASEAEADVMKMYIYLMAHSREAPQHRLPEHITRLVNVNQHVALFSSHYIARGRRAQPAQNSHEFAVVVEARWPTTLVCNILLCKFRSVLGEDSC